jgi:hypothetical protein
MHDKVRKKFLSTFHNSWTILNIYRKLFLTIPISRPSTNVTCKPSQGEISTLKAKAGVSNYNFHFKQETLCSVLCIIMCTMDLGGSENGYKRTKLFAQHLRKGSREAGPQSDLSDPNVEIKAHFTFECL